MEYFIPTILTAMASNIAIMVDSTIVGNLLGSAELSSVNLLSPVNQLYFSMSILFGLSAASIIAKVKGADGTDRDGCNNVFTTGFLSLAVLCIILMVVQFVFLDNIVNLLTSDENLRILVKQYYIPLIAGTPITLFMTSGIHLVRTDGRPKFASKIIIIANCVNLVLDLITILLFKAGIMGASISTVIGNTVGVVLLLTHFRRNDNTLRLNFKILKDLSVFAKNLIDLLATGVSGALATLLITVKMLFLNTIIQQYGGQSALVAYAVVSLCQVFVSAFVTGASQTMIPIVSLLMGEKDYKGVKFTFRYAFRILLICSLAITAIAEIIPESIVRLYGLRTAEDLAMGISALRISSLLFPAMAITFLIQYFFMCTGKRSISTTISVINGVVFVIPFGLLFSYLFGITGVWIALVAAQFATLIVVIAIASIVKLRSKGRYRSLYLIDENTVDELLSFSIDKNSSETVRKYITEKVNERTADAVCAVLDILNAADLEKRRKRNYTDIRICKDQDLKVIIKNSGASVGEDAFSQISSVKYAKVLGFNQIRITMQEG